MAAFAATIINLLFVLPLAQTLSQTLLFKGRWIRKNIKVSLNGPENERFRRKPPLLFDSHNYNMAGSVICVSLIRAHYQIQDKKNL